MILRLSFFMQKKHTVNLLVILKTALTTKRYASRRTRREPIKQLKLFFIYLLSFLTSRKKEIVEGNQKRIYINSNWVRFICFFYIFGENFRVNVRCDYIQKRKSLISFFAYEVATPHKIQKNFYILRCLLLSLFL